MYIHTITMEVGMDVLNIYSSRELTPKQELEAAMWIDAGELMDNWDEKYGYEGDQYAMDCVNWLVVDGEEAEYYEEEEFNPLRVPDKGLYATGGGVRVRCFFTLELPDEETFDSKKLVVKDYDRIAYQLEDQEIEAQISEGSWDDEKGDPYGDAYYCNGKKLE